MRSEVALKGTSFSPAAVIAASWREPNVRRPSAKSWCTMASPSDVICTSVSMPYPPSIAA